MPKVKYNGKTVHFDYTPSGIAMAKRTAKKYNTKVIWGKNDKVAKANDGLTVPNYTSGGGVTYYDKQKSTGGSGGSGGPYGGYGTPQTVRDKDKDKDKNKEKENIYDDDDQIIEEDDNQITEEDDNQITKEDNNTGDNNTVDNNTVDNKNEIVVDPDNTNNTAPIDRVPQTKQDPEVLNKKIYGETGKPQTTMTKDELNKEAYGKWGGPQSKYKGDEYIPQSTFKAGENPNINRPEGNYGHESRISIPETKKPKINLKGDGGSGNTGGGSGILKGDGDGIFKGDGDGPLSNIGEITEGGGNAKKGAVVKRKRMKADDGAVVNEPSKKKGTYIKTEDIGTGYKLGSKKGKDGVPYYFVKEDGTSTSGLHETQRVVKSKDYSKGHRAGKYKLKGSEIKKSVDPSGEERYRLTRTKKKTWKDPDKQVKEKSKDISEWRYNMLKRKAKRKQAKLIRKKKTKHDDLRQDVGGNVIRETKSGFYHKGGKVNKKGMAIIIAVGRPKVNRKNK